MRFQPLCETCMPRLYRAFVRFVKKQQTLNAVAAGLRYTAEPLLDVSDQIGTSTGHGADIHEDVAENTH